MDIIQKSGSWYSYEGNRLGQGMDKVRMVLREQPELYKELEVKIRTKMDEAIRHISETGAPQREETVRREEQ